MSGRFMKIRRIIIPTITMVIIASQLFGCSCSTQSELHKMIERGEQIEIEVPEPNFEEQGTETKITWVELAKLMTYASYRTGVDNAFQITSDGISKYGVIYVDSQGNQTGNATLYDAFMNKAFVEQYWNNDTVQSQLADGISTVYTDLEESDTQAAIINAYWNLLPDNEPNFFNGGASLSRAEAMALIMRATTPVETLKSHEDFISAVGDSDYAGYANYVVENSYLNTSDKSLNNQTFNGTMTRGEYIYLLVANTFGIDSINNVEIGNVKLNDCKDGGNIAKAQKFSGKDYCKSYELVYALQNPDDGAPTSMYKAIVKANQLGIINAETAWDEGITRTDAIDLFISATQAKAKLDGYAIEEESGKVNTTEYTKEAEASYEANKDDLTCSKEDFVKEYVSTRLDGKTAEEALASCLVSYTKKPDATVEEPSSNKELETYLDKDGVPHIKVEETTQGNGKFKYKEDINTIEDTHEYFESLGYKLSTPVTKDELMVIYNDFKSVINPKEIDDAMAFDLELALSGIAWATLPSNPNKPDKEQATTGSSNVVIDSYYTPEVETTWKPQSSNKEEETTSNFWDANYDGVSDDMFDDLTSEDNIFD